MRLGSEAQPAHQAWLLVHVTTPFVGWQSTRVRTEAYQLGGLLRANASLSWAQAQRVALAVRTQYVHTGAELLSEFRAELNSTVAEVPTALANWKHHHRGGGRTGQPHHVITDVHLRHGRIGEPVHVLAAASDWTLSVGRDRGANQTVKGSVRFRSPLEGYRLGGLYAKFGRDAEQRLSGAVALDVEASRYRAFVQGYARRLTDSMFQLNVTTPHERFARVVCRLGASDRERHAVAEVRLPASALGVELLWAIDAMSRFDVLLSVETPMEAFQRVRLVAKMRDDTVDMRGAWNRMVVGYVGVWRMVSYRDVEYSYRVFTPLERFEENGVVVKYVQRDGLEVEVFGRVAAYKIGVVINAKPKPALRALVGTQPQRSVYFSAESQAIANEWSIGDEAATSDQTSLENAIGNSDSGGNDNEEATNEDVQDEEDEDDGADLFNYVASLQVDTLVWPTVTGEIEVDEIDDDFIVVGTLKLPQGAVLIKDRFEFPDYFNVTNTLKITTPFAQCSELQLKYTHAVEIGVYYTSGLNLAYRSAATGAQLVQLGAAANYSKIIEPDRKAHQLQIALRTPLARLERIAFDGRIEHDDGAYRANCTTSTTDTRVSVAGSFEAEPNYVDSQLTLQLSAPQVPRLNVHVFAQRQLAATPDANESASDAISTESRVAFGFAAQETADLPTHLRVLSTWTPNRAVRFELQTNLCAVHGFNASAAALKPTAQQPVTVGVEAEMSYILANGRRSVFGATATRNHDLLTVAVHSAPQHFGNVTVTGVLSAKEAPDVAGDLTAYQLRGTCTRNADTPFPVDGVVVFDHNRMPVGTALQFRPAPGRAVSLDYKIQPTVTSAQYRGYAATVQLAEGDRSLGGSIAYHALNRLDWQLQGDITAVDPARLAKGDQRIHLTAAVGPTVDGQINAQLSLDTPWSQLGIAAVRLQSNVTLLSDAGGVDVAAEIGRQRVLGRYTWTWQPQRDMQAMATTTLLAGESGAESRHQYVMGAKYLDYTTPTGTEVTTAAKQRQPTASAALGVQLNVDQRWHLQSNATWRRLLGETGGTLHVRLPDGQPAGDVHKFSGHLRSNLNPERLDLTNADVNYDLRYETDRSRRLFSSRGQYRNVTDLQGAMRVVWGRDAGRQSAEANVQMLRKEQRREFSARVSTPWHVEEDTLRASGFYDVQSDVQLIKSVVRHTTLWKNIFLFRQHLS